MFSYYLFNIISTVFGAFGAYFLKKSSNNKNILFEINFYLGGFLYFLGAIGCILALKVLPYKTVYFLCSLTYLWSFLIGVILLKEKFSFKKIINIILIICGIILITC